MIQLSHQDRPAIEAEIRAGNKIQAIKLYREAVPGTGLAEAKQIIEAWEQQCCAQPAGECAAPPKKGGGLGLHLIQEQRQRIEAEVLAGHKIQAIKLYREAVPGTGLAEAKQIVETWEQQLRQQAPDRFTAAPKKSGCLGVLAAATLLAGTALAAIALVLGE